MALLAREHDVTPKVVYAAYSRVERNGGLDAEDQGNMVLVKYVV